MAAIVAKMGSKNGSKKWGRIQFNRRKLDPTPFFDPIFFGSDPIFDPFLDYRTVFSASTK